MVSLNLVPDDDGLRAAAAEMNKLHCEENEGYTTHIISQWPNIRDFKQRVSFGVFSWTLHGDKVKLIHKDFVRDIGAGPQTPSSIAREYLSVRYARFKRRALAEQKNLIMEHRAAPLYARPAHITDACYVDVVSTYWTIMLIGGWNVDYYPAQWVIPGRAPLDFPASSDKLARNILVSAGLSSPSYTWTGDKFISKWGRNQFINYSLWAFVQDILHCLAVDALECGAFYVHTDGYILPTNRVNDFYERAAAWGIPVKTKARGNTWVLGVGNYVVGDYRVKRPHYQHERPFANIRFLPYRHWLRRNVKECIEKGISERVYYETLFQYNINV